MPKNKNNKIDLDMLKQLLLRFFEKGTEITDDKLLYAAQFLFGEAGQPVLKGHRELQPTLNYLRNVMRRNHFLELDDLFKYYEKKRSKIADLFEKLEATDPEECFAVSFRYACTMYMRILPEEHAFKSNCLYYLQEGECAGAGFKLIAYKATDEDEKQYLSQVEGNKLVRRSEKCGTCNDRTDELVSN
jgi:hypothetical protein